MVEWIEILDKSVIPNPGKVSTLVVEWIEIYGMMIWFGTASSPPSWWSGLKYSVFLQSKKARDVSTLVVEWIEILTLESIE